METIKPETLRITIDKKEFEVDQYISGKTIKRLAGITRDMELYAHQRYRQHVAPVWRAYVLYKGEKPDRHIADDEIIDACHPDIKGFFTAHIGTTES